MLSSQPSTPVPRYRQQQQQLPYRDDPEAPPSSRLESDTYGGYGNTVSIKGNNTTPKTLPLHIYYSIRSCCHRICHPATSTATYDGSSSSRPDAAATSYYMDDFNDQSYSWCTCGTDDENGVWMNRNDAGGTIMSGLVWFLISYASFTMTFLANSGGIGTIHSCCYSMLSFMALATHVKTTVTDPGSVPLSAVPTALQRQTSSKLCMCSQCKTFKPPSSHHCRICNRCISRMDHHCPWMNNCIGAGNLKHFFLFLLYTWSASAFGLIVLGHHYFFCSTEECIFNFTLTQLVRIMTVLMIGAFLFTSSMLMNVVYGIMTGIGTIDRLKKKSTGTMADADEEPIPLIHIFGIGPYYTWLLPVDPLFPDYDTVMGFATPQRLLREQMREGYDSSSGSVIGMSNNGFLTSGSMATASVISSRDGTTTAGTLSYGGGIAMQ